ncbi:MarR family winged helix-turn-helix transcriptional regulator [Streptomyces fuscigenes]|uniref:MarR family winged helix-turn-helix transcriptional regulator n=1 Tax=Streptomyces fuscigenes TaxID=1528880 RepID=UPI001F24CF83|nr:MarR family transcriptional regulator [Streptomyces fuscigenes]MCF3962145.1 MarR family transcriptional regulator [Streptomyces fuscigenes]
MADTSGNPTSEQVAADIAAVTGLLARRLRSTSAATGLTASQRSALVRINDDGPSTTAALARAEHIRPQSMRLTLGVLEEQGLIERAPDPSDGRQSVVSATEHGRTVLAGVRAAKQTWLSKVIAEELDADDRRTLATAAALLRRLTEK